MAKFMRYVVVTTKHYSTIRNIERTAFERYHLASYLFYVTTYYFTFYIYFIFVFILPALPCAEFTATWDHFVKIKVL